MLVLLFQVATSPASAALLCPSVPAAAPCNQGIIAIRVHSSSLTHGSDRGPGSSRNRRTDGSIRKTEYGRTVRQRYEEPSSLTVIVQTAAYWLQREPKLGDFEEG